MRWDVISVVLIGLAGIGIWLHAFTAWMTGKISFLVFMAAVVVLIGLILLMVSVILKIARREEGGGMDL